MPVNNPWKKTTQVAPNIGVHAKTGSNPRHSNIAGIAISATVPTREQSDIPPLKLLRTPSNLTRSVSIDIKKIVPPYGKTHKNPMALSSAPVGTMAQRLKGAM